MKWLLIVLVGIVSGCARPQNIYENRLSSIQLIDRNGFKETISSPERLKCYQNTNFCVSQPYEKVMRIYTRNIQGKTPSKLTTYHSNGEPWQYLEVINGRACGTYREWHENGALCLELSVIEGVGDLSTEAQLSWVFDGYSYAMDDQGRLQAEIYYEKGKLQGPALYFHPNGRVSKIIPYEKNIIDGEVLYYDLGGALIGKTPYIQGKRHGLALFKGDSTTPPYSEEYRDNLLVEAIYHNFSGNIIATVEKGDGWQANFENGQLMSMQEYKKGSPEGEVQKFDERGNLESIYQVKNGVKHGEEWVYYPMHDGEKRQAKLYLQWNNESIQGTARSWYPNGVLESEREIYDNCKHGTSSAWYSDGSLMMVEEYENDQLFQGTYMRKGCLSPVSSVINGEGMATLHDAEGVFIKRVSYKKGYPVDGI